MSIDTGKGSTDADIKEQFFRQFKQEETSLQEQMILLKESALQPAERTTITDQCLSSISQLSNKLKDASAYLPAYDQRIYSTTVKSLHENLQGIRNASAPRRKFAFKKTGTPKGPSNPGNAQPEDVSVPSHAATSPSAQPAPSSKPKESHNGLVAEPVSGAAAAAAAAAAITITITSLSRTHHKLPSASLAPNSSISVTQIHHSFLDLSASLSRPFATLALHSVRESLLLCGRTSGAAHITGVRNSTLIIWSRQVRMHECSDCLVYLRCGSRPIVEDCRGIRFTPFSPVRDDAASPRPESPNLWDQVDDFKWLRAEHSPNWSTLQPGDAGTIESGQWEVLNSFNSAACTSSELDDLLRAAKVI